jgi:hypothetical protein
MISRPPQLAHRVRRDPRVRDPSPGTDASRHNFVATASRRVTGCGPSLPATPPGHCPPQWRRATLPPSPRGVPHAPDRGRPGAKRDCHPRDPVRPQAARDATNGTPLPCVRLRRGAPLVAAVARETAVRPSADHVVRSAGGASGCRRLKRTDRPIHRPDAAARIWMDHADSAGVALLTRPARQQHVRNRVLTVAASCCNRSCRQR